MTIRIQGMRRADARPILARGPKSRRLGRFGLWLAVLTMAAASPAGAVRTPDQVTDAGFVIPGAGAVTVADARLRGRLDRSLAGRASGPATVDGARCGTRAREAPTAPSDRDPARGLAIARMRRASVRVRRTTPPWHPRCS
jgi:hypothetical protein